MGGKFGDGFLSGGIGHITGSLGGSIGGDIGGIIGASLGAGISSAVTGGDFARGAQIGALQYTFNSLGEGVVKNSESDDSESGEDPPSTIGNEKG